MGFEWIADGSAWLGLLTLTLLELVLGIDNIIFIAILASRLAPGEQARARKLGLLLALVSRILLLLSIGYVARARGTVFELPVFHLSKDAREISWRDLILLGGGAFLIWKAVKEIHHKLEGGAETAGAVKAPTLGAVLIQIMLMDVIFSIDSVITAVGMVDQILVMILAVMVSVGIMIAFSTRIANFVEKHPTIKMLALSFLILIGFNLLAEGCGQEIPKGYTYVAMSFALAVELLNIRTTRRLTGKAGPH